MLKQKFATKTRKAHRMLSENNGFLNRDSCSSGWLRRSSTIIKAIKAAAAAISAESIRLSP
ncbi:hypothetical protein D3C85_1507370 [compost metagenome]